jgi:hypothetical protein
VRTALLSYRPAWLGWRASYLPNFLTPRASGAGDHVLGLLHHHSATPWARSWYRPLVCDEVIIGVSGAAEERTPSTTGPPLNNLSITARSRTRDAYVVQDWFGGAAIGESGAGQEVAKSTELHHHRLATAIADLAGFVLLFFDSGQRIDGECLFFSTGRFRP